MAATAFSSVPSQTAGRIMPLEERLQHLVEGLAMPVAAFSAAGRLIGANEVARPLLGFQNLVDAGLDDARHEALKVGAVVTAIDIGRMVLQRVGSGADIGLVALLVPDVAHVAEPEPVAAEPPEEKLPDVEPPVSAITAHAAPEHEPPAPKSEVPTPLELFDAFAEPPAADEPVAAQPSASEPHVALPDPAPHFDAIADEPPAPSIETPAPPIAAHEEVPALLDASSPAARRLPLRFMWQMDRDGRFSLGADEFTRLIGPRTVAGFGRLWREISEAYGLDPDDRVMQAFATHQTWSGITLNWPVDGGSTLPVELSGLPIFDRARNFAGYRGFGVCRDLDGLARLAALRRYEFFGGAPAAMAPEPLAADIVAGRPCPGFGRRSVAGARVAGRRPAARRARKNLPAEDSAAADFIIETSVASPAELPEPIAQETSHPTDLDNAVEPPVDTATETSKNVLPFRPPGDSKPPSLTPVENSAFNELARQLSARLETEMGNEPAPAVTGIDETVVEKVASVDAHAEDLLEAASEAPVTPQPEWLAPSEPPARGETRRDKALLDLLPVGILIYRLDRLLYANPAFLTQMGYPTLHALEDAGGLDALYVEAGVSNASSTSDTGTPVTISASQPQDSEARDAEAHPATASTATDARLYTISWDGDSALALIFSGARHESAAVAAAIAEPAQIVEPEPIAETLVPEPEPLPAGHADAEELGAILDTTAEGIVMFDAEGNISSANRSAEALFGYDGEELARRNLAELFAPESQHGVFDYLAGGQIIRRRQPARTRPRDARAREQGRLHSAVDDDGTHAPRRSEFLCGVPRPVAGQEQRKRAARSPAPRRARRQRQGRRAGPHQPRGAHAAQRHHRLCRGDDRRTLRRARQ